jgi:hypothetical protein
MKAVRYDAAATLPESKAFVDDDGRNGFANSWQTLACAAKGERDPHHSRDISPERRGV